MTVKQIAYAERRGPKDGEYKVLAFDARGQRMPECDYFTTDRTDADMTARAMCTAQKPTCADCKRPLPRAEAKSEVCNSCYGKREGHAERFGQ